MEKYSLCNSVDLRGKKNLLTMLPLLLRPKLLSIRNRYVGNFAINKTFGRDMTMLLFSFLIVWALYYAMSTTLYHIKINQHIAQIHPASILGLIFMTIFMLLLFSNLITALGSLFLSSDLDLILASPISPWRFFLGKISEVFVSSSWMVITFGFPVIIAFAVYYQASFLYYILALATIFPLLVIPSAISICLVTIFARFVPVHRTKEVLLTIASLAFISLFIIYRNFFTAPKAPGINDIIHIISILKATSFSWLPSYWVCIILGEALEPTGKNLWPYFSMLYSSSIVCITFAYLIMTKFHRSVYSNSGSQKSRIKIGHSSWLRNLNILGKIYGQQTSTIISKDYKVFLRDMTQAMQLVLLLGLCLLYIYNFRALRVVDTFPDALRLWWQGLLLVGNISLGSFVIAAVATRFVFSAISLEGKAYWIMRAAPISIADFLKAKFNTWYVTVCTIATVLLCSGALAMNVERHGVITCALFAWIIGYGIVGLGVGLGAVYANFDWEHASQLAASFGSLIYMVASAALIAAQVLPCALIIFLKSAQNFGHNIPTLNWYFTTAFCFTFVIYLNYATTRWALKIGENSLAEREQ